MTFMLFPITFVRHRSIIILVCVAAIHAAPSIAAALDTRSLKAEALFRLANPCPITGVSNGPCKGYVIDRVIPVVCGGVEESANMQWQTLAEAREKDKWERIGCRPGRVLFRPERPVLIEAFPLADAETPIEGAPLKPGGQPGARASEPNEAADTPDAPEAPEQK